MQPNLISYRILLAQFGKNKDYAISEWYKMMTNYLNLSWLLNIYNRLVVAIDYDLVVIEERSDDDIFASIIGIKDADDKILTVTMTRV